jgi:hypothetical protein
VVKNPSTPLHQPKDKNKNPKSKSRSTPKTGDHHRAASTPPRGARDAPGPGHRAGTTQFTREKTAADLAGGDSKRTGPRCSRTKASKPIRPLCAPHSARKPCVSWGRVAASSPFQNGQPNTLHEHESVRLALPTLQSSSHPIAKSKGNRKQKQDQSQSQSQSKSSDGTGRRQICGLKKPPR